MIHVPGGQSYKTFIPHYLYILAFVKIHRASSAFTECLKSGQSHEASARPALESFRQESRDKSYKTFFGKIDTNVCINLSCLGWDCKNICANFATLLWVYTNIYINHLSLEWVNATRCINLASLQWVEANI
jgi:hypothetical protein